MSPVVIQAENLGKKYVIGHQADNGRYVALRDVLMQNARTVWNKTKDLAHGKHIIPGDTREEIWALKDVSFEIQRGEAVGIIGRNGAGKSTLLKILSRITEPSAGRATIKGRVASLLEVGTGFHPELTGRENIYLNAAILGMARAEVTRKFDEIVAFAEVKKFLDTPVKRYSSGMYLRLAFAVAAHLEPDILVVDEVLAVGDAQFQKKCVGKMEDVAKEGRTVLFVSHNMATINALCERALLFADGALQQDGPSRAVTQYYLSQNAGSRTSCVSFDADDSLRVQVLRAELVNGEDVPGQETVLFRCRYMVRKQLDDTFLGVEVRNASDVSVFYSNDDTLVDKRKRQHGIHCVELSIPKHLLVPGDYYVAFGFWEPGHSAEHAPSQRLFFNRATPPNRLSRHGISWPGAIYLPATWAYVTDDDYTASEAE